MNKNELKSGILEYIESHNGTTFVEIENVFEENNFNYKGDRSIIVQSAIYFIFFIHFKRTPFLSYKY